ncbi:hypothetical protein NPIL_162031 [Nephila pilipes]|uniref:Uncharacterized protein n=1 Tax=Nephila pilipes TaxID=299642 RepID=A0A8X6TZ60_NEPPI|nr:hypothetical protein NPIL_162031 [Nephila pilipes]
MGQWADIPSNVVTLHLELQLLESRFLCFLLLDSAASCTMTFVVSVGREQCSIAGILAACVLMLINQLLPITWTGWTCLRLPFQSAEKEGDVFLRGEALHSGYSDGVLHLSHILFFGEFFYSRRQF